ncbi:uncharacterized protein LOC130629924 [Hydractinia symbiolongicarpus]|uniref:uncharacterized protein LOC130629924 n=1 Tax=Hydractinia symbiolongicarpus TaxID=13093 RepID=UPI00254DEC4B|nr:uncharacterized protein LOC130629924 [Hydractinia symbiolongicarpus]XP_057299284.1 uncharacterized protein LOC130629924 [Hydractinia symbiolongicarpus]
MQEMKERIEILQGQAVVREHIYYTDMQEMKKVIEELESEVVVREIINQSDNQEMKENIDILHSHAVEREYSEINFYQKKVVKLVKVKAERLSHILLESLFRRSLTEYEKNFGYFVGGLPWLKLILKNVCEGKDDTSKAQYRAVLNEYLKMLEKTLSEQKKEVYLSDNVWEIIKNNIKKELPKHLAIKGEEFINTSLSLKNRLHRFVVRLKPNTMYQIEGSRFYKLYNTRYALARLFSLTSKGCSVFEDNFLDCSITFYDYFCLTLKTRKNFRCVIYTATNSDKLIEEHEIPIDGTQLCIGKNYYFSSYRYYIIVRFM